MRANNLKTKVNSGPMRPVIRTPNNLKAKVNNGLMRTVIFFIFGITLIKYTTLCLRNQLDAVQYDPESLTMTTAYKQSYGLLDDVSDRMWERFRLKATTESWYTNPENPLERVNEAEWWNKHNMNPNFNCPHLSRMGMGKKTTEGQKFICNPQRFVHEEKKDCLVYSVGCAGDFKFEDAVWKMHNNGCEIHVFDPADWTRPNDADEKNIHYHAWGLSSSYDNESKSIVWPKGRRGGFKTFAETLKILGHEGRVIDLFKIDCEGCEWSSYKDWIDYGFRQILIEVHGVPRPEGDKKARWYQKPMNVMEYFKDFSDNGYALYSKEYAGLCLELSFIKLHADFWKKD